MPVSQKEFSMPTNQDVAAAVIAEARTTLREAHAKIVHCLDQLDDDQFNWRPFEPANSLANLLLHLCGNMRQWIINGIDQKPDTRHRPSEFSDRKPYAKAELMQRLDDTVKEADATLSRVTAETITQPRRIQGFDASVMHAVFHTVSHFVGHSQEIIYITRLQLREKYRFKFVPQTKEQGAP
jgi:uncharacterized damage-inducible protein DinB